MGFLGEGASSQPSPHQLREARSPKVFNSYFSSVCVTDNGILPNCRNVNLQCILEGMTFESVDVLRSINKMKGMGLMVCHRSCSRNLSTAYATLSYAL